MRGMAMIRTTTPLQVFKFKDDAEALYDKILITYAQSGRILFEKNKEDLSFSTEGDKYIAAFALTQEETKSFNPVAQVSVQVRVLTNTGNSWASKIFTTGVHDVLNDEVL